MRTMRIAWIALAAVVVSSCGKVEPPRPTASPSAKAQAPPTSAPAPTAARAETKVAVSDVTELLPEDLGATKVGTRLVVPGMHELEVTVIVQRKGVLSVDESFINRRGSKREKTRDVSVLIFEPRGVLRPKDSEYAVVLPFGRRLLHPVKSRLREWYGTFSGSVAVGQRHELFCCLFHSGSRVTSGLANNRCDLGIWTYARIVPIASDHPHYSQLTKADGVAEYTAGEELRQIPRDLISEEQASEPGKASP